MSSSDRSDHPISEVVVMSAPSAGADGASEGLLPSGLTDLLAPQAEQDAKAVEAVLSSFAAFGYQRINRHLWSLSRPCWLKDRGLRLLNRLFAFLTRYHGG